MTFLNLIFLSALPLTFVPLILHLYRGRQKEIIEWGATQFLATAASRGRRLEWLEELLLMLLRFLAVAALVFALAQPMIRTKLIAGPPDSEVVLIFDDSLSTSREVNGRSVHSELKEKALTLVDSLGPTNTVQILATTAGQWQTRKGIAADVQGKRQLAEIITQFRPTEATANLLECVRDAAHLKHSEQLTGRRIVIFTDGQASNWQVDSPASWQQFATILKNSSIPTSVQVVECTALGKSLDNLAVTSVEPSTNHVRPGDRLEVTATIRNTGVISVPATLARWRLADEEVAMSEVGALGPHSEVQTKTTVLCNSPGTFVLTCRLDRADQIPLDQEGRTVVQVTDEYPVLFVTEDRTPSANSIAPADFFSAALGFIGKHPNRPWHSIYHPEVTAPTELASLPLSKYHAIVIENIGGLPGNVIERLTAFVDAGGGLWVTLGDRTSKDEFNRDWFNEGDGLSPVAISKLTVNKEQDESTANIRPPSRDNAATAQLANTSQLDIDAGRIHRCWQFADRESGNDTVSMLLQSGNGAPLVVEKLVGQGRVLVQSFPTNLAWTNVPLLKAYVVMVQDWLDYITVANTARHNLTPGAQIVFCPTGSPISGRPSLTTPHGHELTLTSLGDESMPSFRFARTQQPGIYHVRYSVDDQKQIDVPFQVARPAGESELEPLSQTAKDQVLAAAGLNFITDATATNIETFQPASRPHPIWGALLALLVCLLVGEFLVSFLIARRRSGMLVSAV